MCFGWLAGAGVEGLCVFGEAFVKLKDSHFQSFQHNHHEAQKIILFKRQLRFSCNHRIEEEETIEEKL